MAAKEANLSVINAKAEVQNVDVANVREKGAHFGLDVRGDFPKETAQGSHGSGA